MSSNKNRPVYIPPPSHRQQQEEWLRYPGSEKPSNIHSRSYTPALIKSQEPSRPSHGHGQLIHHASRSETQPVNLHRRPSTSKPHSGNSSNASLPMSLTGSNSSSDSLGYHSYSQSLRSTTLGTKPRSISDELFPAQSNGSDTGMNSRTTAYPSPITPSDLLGIPDPSTFNTSSSSESSSTTLTPADSPPQKADPADHKPRPSPLSIDTTLNNTTFDGSNFAFTQGSPTSVRDSTTNSEAAGSPRVNLASGNQTPPLPRLSHSSSHSSSASNSSYSNPSSPLTLTPPCSALCHHSKGHGHSHSHHLHNHSRSHHKHDKHRHHHSSCHYHSGHRHGAKSDRALKSSSRYGIPQLEEEHDEELSTLSTNQEETQLDNSSMEMPSGIEVTPSSTTTALTIVGSTPAIGISLFTEDQDQNALGLYSEPPKKRQRSTASVILGAAVETVIFTSAVALSAYQLLTGRGRQLDDATMTPATEDVAAADGDANPIKSTPVNIPSRGGRHRESSLLGKSLHHNHHARPHHRSGRNRDGLSSSLPHAYDYDNMKEAMNMTMPERPNTGTEDNDEQFLRMEAQLSSLIAEGKRALNTRPSDWR